AEDGLRVFHVTGVQTCALPISALPRLGASAVLVGAVAAFADRHVTPGRSPAAYLLELARRPEPSPAVRPLDISWEGRAWTMRRKIGRASWRARQALLGRR